MDDNKKISRRDAIKMMGTTAAATAMATVGVAATMNMEEKRTRPLKVIAINGSARKGGNTADMLRVVLGELEKKGIETEYVELVGQSIGGCRACFACAGKGNCVFGGDIFKELYAKMTEADGIVIGSPAYSADVSATLKAVMERASVVSDTNPGMFRHKVCAAVAVARRAGAMNVIDSLNHFFLNKEVFLVGSTYWNIAYGRLPGEAMNDKEGVENMRNLGQNMAWLLQKTC